MHFTAQKFQNMPVSGWTHILHGLILVVDVVKCNTGVQLGHPSDSNCASELYVVCSQVCVVGLSLSIYIL